MNRFKVIAITHKAFGVDEIGKFHMELPVQQQKLGELKKEFHLDELMLLSTCNRVEFLLSYSQPLRTSFVQDFLLKCYPHLQEGEALILAEKATTVEGDEALRHIFNVASSLDSLVVGEREIITQVRNAYEQCKEWGYTGDVLRIVMKKTIECAKKIYTETNIAKNPVSVVSLAYRKLKELDVKLDARFLIVGAGVTNTTMAKYLKKHGYNNFAVFNRTLANAEKLSNEIGGKAFKLNELNAYDKGFDVIVTCTASSDHIITHEIYQKLSASEKGRKVVIDLAVPSDLDPAVLEHYDVNLIAINNLQEIANNNLLEREKELVSCGKIVDELIGEFKALFKVRKVELAMSGVPQKVKEIKQLAIDEVFAKDISTLDERSREVLDKVVAYLEKKYISVPMKMAKDIMLDTENNQQ